MLFVIGAICIGIGVISILSTTISIEEMKNRMIGSAGVILIEIGSLLLFIHI